MREAHATDGRQAQANIRDGVLVANHKTMADREEAAMHCAKDLNLKIPILMDDMKDTTERAYSGWPDRLYVVDKDGVVAYAGSPGPAGFKPSEGQAALAALIKPGL